jgi:hypothetical protein
MFKIIHNLNEKTFLVIRTFDNWELFGIWDLVIGI